ncbi:hypothetical protein BDV93DRAFT_557111 [Ceratobasidium sp. AG-I]|nr:hypothetical protein BDV93DRAFT_557111 [Ceratobasidium sp. AG-I]
MRDLEQDFLKTLVSNALDGSSLLSPTDKPCGLRAWVHFSIPHNDPLAKLRVKDFCMSLLDPARGRIAAVAEISADQDALWCRSLEAQAPC